MNKITHRILHIMLLLTAALLAGRESRAQACTVNLLIAYTDKAADSLNGNAQAVNKIAAAVNGLNNSFIYSKVMQQAVLVRTVRLNAFESGCFADDLNSFQASAYINALRDKYHADIAALIFTNTEFCGLPYLDNEVATDSTAYCAVNYLCMLSNFALSHQVAHLYGCGHYAEDSAFRDGAAYPYGHGYRWAFSADKCTAAFTTILGVDDDDFCMDDSGEVCTVVPYFSNPAVLYNGVPTGIAGTNDNARVLNNNAGVIGALKLLPVNQLNLTDSVNLFNIAIATAGDTLSTGQNYRITDSAAVSFRAGKRIVLNPGFTASDGVRFEAVISPGSRACGQ